MFPAALFRCGQEPLKAEAACRLTGDAQGGDDGAGAGNGANRDSRLGALLYQVLTWVRDGGASGIGYQGAGLSGQNAVQNFFPLEGFVVLVVAHQGLFQFQVVEELQRDPGVLRGDEIRAFQRGLCPGGNVPQIADGGGNQI